MSAGAGSGTYVGRFAPSPTGPLHDGSLVAALASWLDARARGGRWLVRIEDVDRARCVRGMDRHIVAQLARCGLVADKPPVRQSAREALYVHALQRLHESGWAYDCGCTRREIDAAWRARGVVHERHAERIYPGTCRGGLHGRPARSVRMRTLAPASGEAIVVRWHDRRLGPQHQDVTHAVGDFVLRRADGPWAYQLAVVVDDAEQGVTHVVRGEDLADNTARQILLQRALGAPTPQYLHTPLVLAADGSKLSKQTGAREVDLGDPLAALRRAGAVLGIGALEASDVPGWLAAAVRAWPYS